jgi:hypothetical protein
MRGQGVRLTVKPAAPSVPREVQDSILEGTTLYLKQFKKEPRAENYTSQRKEKKSNPSFYLLLIYSLAARIFPFFAKLPQLHAVPRLSHFTSSTPYLSRY